MGPTDTRQGAPQTVREVPATPRVSIGLPVRNGGRYLAQAIESVLEQTYRDFELILCDNASTDNTAEICQRYAARDARVRVERSERNVGAAGNFNRALRLARGEYFKWVAHDDLCAPTFIERCVAVLDAAPNVTVAHPRARLIDADGTVIGDHQQRLATHAHNVLDRVAALTRGHQCYEIFGLMRSSVLCGLPPMGDHFGADAILLLRLALVGPFREIPEPLFLRRTHDEQSESMRARPAVYAAWWNPDKAGRIVMPYWRLLYELLVSIRRAQLGIGDRLWCFLLVGYWCVRRVRRLGTDVLRAGATLLAWPFRPAPVLKERAGA